MLQGKQNRNVGGRETVLARGEWEHQLIALVSKDRARHCMTGPRKLGFREQCWCGFSEVQVGLGSSCSLLPGRV